MPHIQQCDALVHGLNVHRRVNGSGHLEKFNFQGPQTLNKKTAQVLGGDDITAIAAVHSRSCLVHRVDKAWTAANALCDLLPAVAGHEFIQKTHAGHACATSARMSGWSTATCGSRRLNGTNPKCHRR